MDLLFLCRNKAYYHCAISFGAFDQIGGAMTSCHCASNSSWICIAFSFHGGANRITIARFEAMLRYWRKQSRKTYHQCAIQFGALDQISGVIMCIKFIMVVHCIFLQIESHESFRSVHVCFHDLERSMVCIKAMWDCGFHTIMT